MTATVAGIHLGLDTHANRPAANAVPDGSLYSCSTHSLLYKSNFAGNSWATYATLGGTGMTNPMFATGDSIYSSSGSTPAALAIGAAYQVKRVNAGGTAPEWAGGKSLWSEISLSGGAAASIDFTSIPATAKHIEILMMVRGAKAAAYDDLHMTLNNDSSSIYDYQLQSAYQSTNAASENLAAAFWLLGQPAAASAGASLFSYYRLTIPYYADTNHRRQMRMEASEITAESTGSYLVRHMAGHYRSTTAVSRVTLAFAGGNVAQYSRASLYLVS